MTIEKVCIDPKLAWSQIANVWYNAGVRSVFYAMAAPLRWLLRKER
jgi:uncharacterized membrane protein